jgi:hypothetical protein
LQIYLFQGNGTGKSVSGKMVWNILDRFLNQQQNDYAHSGRPISSQLKDTLSFRPKLPQDRI